MIYRFLFWDGYTMREVPLSIVSDEIELRGYLARPDALSTSRAVVLCHGFPQDNVERLGTGLRYVELADRIAAQVCMRVLTLNLRGTGESGGDFSLQGWIDDIRAAIDYLAQNESVAEVLLVGFGVGGSLALVVASDEAQSVSCRVVGVAAMGARTDFCDVFEHADDVLVQMRNIGLIRDAEFPPDPVKWSNEFREIKPIESIVRIPPRPLLLLHGSADRSISANETHELAAAVHGAADVREISGAGHRLRHDPRVVAILLGWLDDQL